MPNYQDGFVDANGLKLHYYRAGQPGRPALVCLHGITDDGRCFPRLADALGDEYELILPDARGHGLSEQPASGYSLDNLAADAAGFIEALGLGQPVVLGHSMGAATAAVLAARRPELVRLLVLEDPPYNAPGFYSGRESAAGRQNMLMWMLSVKEKTQAELEVECRAQNPLWDESEIEPWAHSKQLFSLAVAQSANWDRPDWREVAAALPMPGLLITADPQRGAIVTEDVAGEVPAHWPQCQVAHIHGAGHSIRRDQFAAYLAAMRQFLQVYA